MTKSAYKINIIALLILLTSFILLWLSGSNQILFLGTNKVTSFISPFIWANLTFLGDTLTACAIMLLFIRKRPDLVWAGLLASILAALVVNLLKFYFNVPRPPAIIDKEFINIIGPALTQHSFPSGHTVTAFTLVGVIIFSSGNIVFRTGLMILSLLIGISRIAVGVHWPADVLAGAVLGIFCALSGMCIVEKLKWESNIIAQELVGSGLILSTIYLMIFYDCKYEQAVYLKFFLSVAILIVGSKEFFLIVKNR